MLLLHIPFVHASLLSFNGTSISALDASESPSCGDTRSLSDIIWSCAATLFACTWTAIHPNIPGMEEEKWTVFSRRLGIMIMALIAPELIITWATLQFLSAQWTVTHGFFAWMGGFMLYVNGEPLAPLRPDELLSYVDYGSVDVPVIVEADIEDRSKGDALSKGIAVLQLAWFILQLAARYFQDLPMTLLEIDTLAVAALTSIAYGFWWKKPKDVGRPYAVHWKATYAPSREAYNAEDEDFSNKNWLYYLVCLFKPFLSLAGISEGISPRANRERRVPILGGYDDNFLESRNHVITLFFGCFSGMVFGAIHCLGWNFLFQGHAEQILWRAASLAIISAPLSILLLFSYVVWLTDWKKMGSSVVLAVSVNFFIYFVARVILIVLLLMSLRSLPPGVYDVVAWTKFFPHF
ncbi:hypothetical protein DEU56DRAFT_736860 [Suillus clintonianus]|uniref:uncharacterized protein n=1 Tax=Suillus clintonianus TaxID=1904413 RepID=UPI001B862E6C|nr:uncharacterized protein DEU56DRAFT_736860 [Suillus clintonianus]KAG2137509.1 hypothetical protein DEU56DRAFT_736860 [Suillus clintonianus]